jgi:hypothetical protein
MCCKGKKGGGEGGREENINTKGGRDGTWQWQLGFRVSYVLQAMIIATIPMIDIILQSLYSKGIFQWPPYHPKCIPIKYIILIM